jgi:hypothetical protein
MSANKVVEMPNKQMETTLKAIREIQEALPVVIEGQKALAQATRARYLALVKEGFTPEQALELCKQ